MKRKHLPSFEKVFKDGIISDLLSVYPYVTAPAWTTIFSGVNPGKHGIFEMYEIINNTIRPSNMMNSDVPYLWDYLSWANKKTLALGIPFIYPAPKINGIFVTGRFVPKLSCYPDHVRGEFDLSGFEFKELPTEQGIENVISKGSAEISRIALDELKLRIKASLSLIASEKWDTILLVDNLPDEILHISYEDNDIVEKMFLLLDDFLGQLLQRLGPDDHLVIVSDHGFSEVKNVLFINEWLRSKGYLVVRQSSFSKLLFFFGIDWDKLSKPGLLSKVHKIALKYFPQVLNFTKNQASSGFLVDDSTKLSSNVCSFSINEPVAWIRLSKENETISRDSLYTQLDELKKQSLLKNVFKTDEIFHGKYVKKAIGQLLIEAYPGWAVDTSRLNNGRLVGRPLLTKKGIHKREGIFAYFGHSFARASDSTYRLQDVSPTVLDLMDLPIPKIMDGSPILEKKGAPISSWNLDIAQRL